MPLTVRLAFSPLRLRAVFAVRLPLTVTELAATSLPSHVFSSPLTAPAPGTMLVVFVTLTVAAFTVPTVTLSRFTTPLEVIVLMLALSAVVTLLRVSSFLPAEIEKSAAVATLFTILSDSSLTFSNIVLPVSVRLPVNLSVCASASLLIMSVPNVPAAGILSAPLASSSLESVILYTAVLAAFLSAFAAAAIVLVISLHCAYSTPFIVATVSITLMSDLSLPSVAPSGSDSDASTAARSALLATRTTSSLANLLTLVVVGSCPSSEAAVFL